MTDHHYSSEPTPLWGLIFAAIAAMVWFGIVIYTVVGQ